MIRQFDVVTNPETADAAFRPYLVVLQSDLVSGLRSTVVAPLVAHEQSGAQRMNPVFTIEGADYWLATHELFAVEQKILKRKIASLADRHDTIMAALDFIFTGV